MRLLYASDRPPYPFMQGGASRSAHYLLTALKADYGVECLAVGSKDFPPAGWSTPKAEDFDALGISEITHEGDTTSIQCGYTAQVRGKFRDSLGKVIDDFAPDVVWTQLDGMEPVARIAVAKGRNALVYLRDAETSPAALKSIAASGCRIVCNSRFIAARTAAVTGKRSRVIYPSLDTAYGVSGDPQGVITMINPHPVKGIDTLLEIARRMPGEEFLIVESWVFPPSMIAALREKIASLPNVQFQHRLPDVRAIYRKTKLLLAPSVWEEAFGRVVIEAQSCRIPVIASERGGLPEAVGDGGICIKDYLNPAAWVAAIKDFLDDRNEYQRIAHAGLRHANSKIFSTRYAANRLFEMISEISSGIASPEAKPDRNKEDDYMTTRLDSSPERKIETGQPLLRISDKEFYESRALDAVATASSTSRYIIYSSERTGSTYLCGRLCNVKDRFGLPSEYLNPKAIQSLAPRLSAAAAKGLSLPEYLGGVRRLRTTADGWFGIKVQPKQLLPHLPKTKDSVTQFLQRFERIIVLTRRDKVGQAISGAIAEASRKWYTDGTEPALRERELENLNPLVAAKLDQYVREEISILDAATRTRRPVLYLEYEEIQAESDAALDNVLVHLGEPRGLSGVEEVEIVKVTEKPAGELAKRLRVQFMDFIAGAGKFSIPRARRSVEKPE